MAPAKPGGAFRWVDAPWGPTLRCVPLHEHADHLMTTRLLASSGGDDERWQGIAETLGIQPDALARVRQVHGRHTILVGRSYMPHPSSAAADAIITRDPELGLAVQVADCVPVLLADTRTGAVAAVHAGWRGTLAGVVPSAIGAMRAEFDTRPGDLMAAIGPSIGPCCYEVGDEVRDAFVRGGRAADVLARWFVRGRGVRPHLDLWTVCRDQLRHAGLRGDLIFTAGLCTADHLDVFYSYRAEGPTAGRMAAAISPKRSRVVPT